MSAHRQNGEAQGRRHRSTFARLLLMTTPFVFLSSLAFAQSDPVFDAKGFQQNRDYFSQLPFEHIDTLSGGLILTFTDLALPGNAGRELRFQRTYNSKGATGQPWSFGIAGVPMRVIHPAGPSVYPPAPGDTSEMPVLVMAGGELHKTTFVDPNVVITREFWKYNRVTRVASLPDGTTCAFDAGGLLTEIRDPFNNVTTIATDTTSWHVHQALGNGEARDVDVDSPDPAAILVVPTALRFGGRTWTYEYITPGHLSRVVPPVGPAWEYAYDASSLLSQVTTPFGGTIAYTYASHQFLREQISDPTPIQVYSTVLETRTVDGDVQHKRWTYTYTEEGEGYTNRTTVATPSGASLIYIYGLTSSDLGTYYPAAQYGIRRQMIEQPAGTEWEREDWLYIDVPGFDGSEGVVRQHTTRRDGGGVYATTFSYHTTDGTHYADYHQPWQIAETGELGRTTTRTFDYGFTGRYIIGTLESETVTVNGESFTTNWTYNHDTGFKTSERVYGILTTFAPDAVGNVASVTKGNGKTTTFSSSWGVIKDIHTPEYTTTRTINPEGTVASETSAERTVTFTYDDLFRIRITQPPGSNMITTTYNTDGSTVAVSRGSSSITTTLDGFGRPIATVNSLGIQTRTGYDAEGRTTYEGYPFTSTDVGTAITYDALGRVTRRTNRDSTYQEFTYGPGTVTIRDENANVTVQTYQAFGSPDDARLAQVLDAKQKTWGYSYNALGKLTRVTAPDGIVREWVYDRRNLLVNETHPESGTVTYNSYDDAGNLLRKTDARGTGFVFGYDGNDRLKTILSGAQVTAIAYEPGSDRRQVAVVGTTSTTFTYDGAGRLAKRDDVIDGRAFVRRFDYDDNDNLKEITYASGRHVRFGFDNENRISQILDQTFGRNLATDFDYHPSGAETRFTSGNLILNQMTFDAQRYWPRSITAGPLGVTYLGLTYDTYDGVGNIKQISDSRGPSFVQTFDYDPLYRMTQAQGPYGSFSVTYDAHGNRLSGTTYTYDPGTLRLINQGGMQYSYDNNGNLITGPNATYTYTPDNMLESATLTGGASVYAYDADNWRIKAVTPDGTSYFLRGPQGELLTEVRNPGTPSAVIKDYVYAGRRLVAVISLP